MKARTKWIVIAVIVIAFAGYGAYLKTQNEANGLQQKEIRIGVIAPLTGNFALQGERIRNGMELAREELLQNNISIKIIYEDACIAKDTIPAFTKLTESDNVSMIGGSFCLAGFVPLIPMAQQKNIIMFNTAKNPSIVLNKSIVFSTNLAIEQDSEFQARFAADNISAKTSVIIYYTTPFGQDFAKYIPIYFEQYGGKILSSQQVELSATDFRTELTKIKELKPDVIFAVHLSNSLGNLIKEARELGINSTIISNSEAEDPSVIAAAGDASEGFVISSSEPEVKSAAAIEFESKYKERFNDSPNPIASNAYDSLKIQALVYEKCNGLTECMKKELHKISGYEGASGTITIREDGSSYKPLLMKIVRNGTFVRYP